ncbi:AAA family ATPase [Crateriforma conspicua]|uniref:Chromosome partition protein Smc n=1 Tax=Crateriforma conspicua TaxID=2527996 RepID=A0A5C5YB19_9PLAN|nr:AAA family ATPase [Crateriforma conspicua]TWT71515.1 Chromosome partition protein Smc [Crateriforma conspicua]
MPELDFITIRGFKSIANCEKLKLAPINVVIGPNGSGKSNFIEVFSFLHAIREGMLQNYVGKAGGADRVLHFGAKNTPEMFFHISFEDGLNQYDITLEPTDDDELIPTDETCYFWVKSQYPHPYATGVARTGKEAGISQSGQGRVATYVRKHLAKWRLYHVHDTSRSSPMKKTCDLNDNDFLRPDGSNLAAFLFYLQEEYPVEYGLIRKAVQRVAPFFEDFRLKPSKLNEDKIRLEWKHAGSDAYFDASSFSDGTLRFIALATLLLQPDWYRPSVILIDEPELGLHPYAITMFASLVRQVSHETQVILSTQSPLLLDHFEPEDVLVADRVNGATTFTRLEVERLEEWLEEYSLGQLWEKNELGGRPGGHA